MSQPDDLDASLADDASFDDALKRVSYQPGMLLGLEATRSEQDYHRRRHTRHAYWLHGSGTVAGLRVAVKAEDPGNDMAQVKVRLTVSPGIAVDGLGREVCVPEPYCIDLGAWLTSQYEEPEAWGALIRDGYATADNLLWLKVTLRYQDCPSGLQPVLATEVNAGTDPVQPSRVMDGVLFELVPERPEDDPGGEHPFASHHGLADYPAVEGKLGAREKTHVDTAAGATRRQLELGARLLHALGDDNRALLPRRAFTTSAAELARTLLARVAIRLTPPSPEPGLVVNPRRIEVDNLVRPFLFNAAALARLIRE